MRKSCIKVIVIVVMMFSFSIYGNAQLKFGVKGGLNLSTLSGMEELIEFAGEYLDGAELPVPNSVQMSNASAFHLGLMLQLNSPTNFFLQPELLFSMQGVKGKASGFANGTDRLNFLKLPVYVGHKINIVQGLDIILGAGPYIAYGVFGSEGAYGEGGMFQHFDAGIAAMGGVQFNQFQLTAGYDWGLVDQVGMEGWDRFKEIQGLSPIRNRNIKVSLGYFF